MDTSYATREELQNVINILLEMHKKIEEIENRMKYLEDMVNDFNETKSLEYAILSVMAIRGTVSLEELYAAFPEVNKSYIRIAMTKLVRANKVRRIARGTYEYLR